MILDPLGCIENHQVSPAQLPRCPDASTAMGHRIQDKPQSQSFFEEAVQEAHPWLGEDSVVRKYLYLMPSMVH